MCMFQLIESGNRFRRILRDSTVVRVDNNQCIYRISRSSLMVHNFQSTPGPGKLFAPHQNTYLWGKRIHR